jgi:hypothetical protein
MKARISMAFAGLAVLALGVGGACLDLDGLDGEDEPRITDGGAPAGGGIDPPAGGGGTMGGARPPMSGGGGPQSETGLVLRRGRLVDGFDGSDWQCNGTLCLRGRITP